MEPADLIAEQRRIRGRNRLRAILAILVTAALGIPVAWSLICWSSNLFVRHFRFETYEEAKRDRDFEWALPSFLPKSATGITEYMEMDDCYAIGSFRFDPATVPACLGLPARQPEDLGKPLRFFKEEDWQKKLGVPRPDLRSLSLCAAPPKPDSERPCLAKHPIAVAIDRAHGRAFFWSIDETGRD